MNLEESNAVVEKSDDDKKTLKSHLNVTSTSSDLIEEKEDCDIVEVERKKYSIIEERKEDPEVIKEKEEINEEKVNIDVIVSDSDIDTKVEKKAPSPLLGGSLFLFGTMLKNH